MHKLTVVCSCALSQCLKIWRWGRCSEDGWKRTPDGCGRGNKGKLHSRCTREKGVKT